MEFLKTHKKLVLVIGVILILAIAIYMIFALVPEGRFVNEDETVTRIELKFQSLRLEDEYPNEIIVLDEKQLNDFLDIIKDVKLYAKNIFTFSDRYIRVNDYDRGIVVNKFYTNKEGQSGNSIYIIDLAYINVADPTKDKLWGLDAVISPFMTREAYTEFYLKLLAFNKVEEKIVA